MRNNFQAEIDFSIDAGFLKKRLHGSNSAPCLSSRGFSDFEENFRRMHFTESRNHDWALWNSGQRMIDTHFIFPLLKLDPKDPENYFFDSSDEIIKICQDAGTRVYYRLGTSIEHSGIRHFNTVMPKDFEHYAEVLAGIVRHYTRGWANGFEYDIPYWEIWNEAGNGPSTWDGPVSEYERFFVTIFKRLKSEFPELKFGGPAYCSFTEESYRPFLERCKAAFIVPDFISYHHYTSNEKEAIVKPLAVRKLLDSFGFNQTEIHNNEWHYIVSWEGLQKYVTTDGYKAAVFGSTGLQGINSAIFNLAILSGWHDMPLDAAYYYGAAPEGAFGFYNKAFGLNKNFYSMQIFGDLITNYTKRVKTKSNCETIYTLGAISDSEQTGQMLIADYRGDQMTLNIAVKGMENSFVSVSILDSEHDLQPAQIIWHNNILTLQKNSSGSAAFVVTFEKNH